MERDKTDIGELAASIHAYSVTKGFWPTSCEVRKNEVRSHVNPPNPTPRLDPPGFYVRNLGEALMLVNTELSEALEGFRAGIPLDDPKEGALIEIGDAVIRLLDLGYGVGGEKFIELMLAKCKINDKRPHLHGKAF